MAQIILSWKDARQICGIYRQALISARKTSMVFTLV
jgi:hypothetical protein